MNTFEQARANPIFRDIEDDMLQCCVGIADALLARGYSVTTADVLAWAEGDFEHGDAAAVEHATADYMGQKTIEHYESMARVIPAVEFHLGLSTERYCGGVDVSMSLKGNPGQGFSIVDAPYPDRNRVGINVRKGALSLAQLLGDTPLSFLNITMSQLMAACETKAFQMPANFDLLAGSLDAYGIEIRQNDYGFCLRRVTNSGLNRVTDLMWERHMEHMNSLSMVERERAEKRLKD